MDELVKLEEFAKRESRGGAASAGVSPPGGAPGARAGASGPGAPDEEGAEEAEEDWGEEEDIPEDDDYYQVGGCSCPEGKMQGKADSLPPPTLALSLHRPLCLQNEHFDDDEGYDDDDGGGEEAFF